MGAIARISIRNMNRRKSRYILTIFALTISVSLFGGILIASDSFEVMMLKTMDQQVGTADTLIRMGENDDGWFDPDDIKGIIEDIANVESLSFRISGFSVSVSYTDEGNQGENSTSSSVYGINNKDPNEPDLGGVPYILDIMDEINELFTIEEMLDYNDITTGSRVVVITESLSVVLGKNISAGSLIWIFPRDGDDLGYDNMNTSTWITYRVVAVIRDSAEAKDLNINANSSSTLSQEGPLFFSSLVNVHELVDGTTDREDKVNLGVVGCDNIYLTSRTSEEISDALNNLDDDNNWSVLDIKSDSLESINTTMNSMRTMFLVIGLIAIILSTVLILNVFNIISEEQKYETGMFQAIGASRKETFRMFLIQGGIMGLIGSGIGTLFSYLISELIFGFTFSSMTALTSGSGRSIISSDFVTIARPSTLIVTFSIGFFSCLIASVYPSYKASKKSIIECLNPIEEKSEREKKKYKKPILYGILAISLILYGLYLYLSSEIVDFTASTGSPNSSQIGQMLGPVLVLLGILVISSIFIRSLSSFVIFLFKPYLQKTTLLTKKNILRHKKRTILTFCMIGLTTSFLIGMSVMLDSVRAGVGTTIDDIIGSDVQVISFGTPHSFENDINNINGVDAVMGVGVVNALIKKGDDWIGHTNLEEDFNTTIMVNIINGTIMKDLLETSISLPTDMTANELYADFEIGRKILIGKKFADDFNFSVGDVMLLNYSVGFTFSSFESMISQDLSSAREDFVAMEMTVGAIIDSIQGFQLDFSAASSRMMGGGFSDVISYPMFISWEIYSNQIAIQNLPGNGIDLMVRQATQTGNPILDLFQSNWVNFSSIESIIDGTEGIKYYTTRMDYYSHTSVGETLNFSIPVVGIHTNSFGNLKSDSVFGKHIILEKNDSYAGTTIEELLNISKNVCVVDENYANSQIANGNPDFGIGTNISIFPYDTDPNAILLNTGMFNTSLIVGEGWLQSGNATDLTFSDDNNVTFISNGENLNTTIDYSPSLTRAPKLVNLTIESRVNSTINQLDLYAYNIYTTIFDYLGDINTISEENMTFYFGLNNSYISPMTGGVKLRIMGHSLTPGVNYSVSIDNIKFYVLQSIHDMNNTSTWPTFEVVGIIKSPNYYNSEHYSWASGFEYLTDSIENSIYINYEKARDLVYLDYKGESLINDKITSIIIKSSTPYDITSLQDELEETLTTSLGGTWTSSDISTFSLEMRNNAFTFYVWAENGFSEEDILTDIQDIIQNNGYLVLFGLTKPYLNSIFSTMINLMSYIMYGMLILSIIISLIGLALHCLLSTMSRRREIGMLRSIGLSKKGVVKTISGETLIVALLGVVIGIIAGLILGIMMVSAMPTDGFLAVTLTIPWLTISILIVITVVAAIFSSRIPARWASNLNIIDAVRTR